MALTAARNVGVQSWSFRHFKSLPDMIAQVKKVGLSRIELCAAHANFDDPSTFQATADTLKAAGIEVLSIGVQTFTGDHKKEKNWFEFAKKVGAKHISAHFKVDSFVPGVAVARALCEAYDMRIGIHCHGGYMFGGSVDILDHLLNLGGERIGLNIDTAWCLQARGNPIEWAKKWPTRIYGTHYKDFVWDRVGKYSEVIPGDGALDLATYVKTLDEISFGGYAVIEYEAEVENPGPTIKKAIDRIKAL